MLILTKGVALTGETQDRGADSTPAVATGEFAAAHSEQTLQSCGGQGPSRRKLSTRNLKAGVLAAAAGAAALGIEAGIANALPGGDWVVIGNGLPHDPACVAPSTVGGKNKSYYASWIGAYVSASNRCHGATGTEQGFVRAFLRHNSEGLESFGNVNGLGYANTGGWTVGADNNSISALAKLRSGNLNNYWHETLGVVYSGSGVIIE